MTFTRVLVAIAVAVALSAYLKQWLSKRLLTAAAADLADVLISLHVTNERGMPETYIPISYGALLAAQVTLLAIFLISTIFQTLLRVFFFKQKTAYEMRT